ncbi:MAG: hypothetical protein FJ304_21940 [Planctomycetes bacterium]|nr:hypothetical protein [Planctomycetota bacterium]
MARVACVFVVLCFASVARTADLPPGALVRLGGDRFRAGGEIEHLALSPDGKQFATVKRTEARTATLTLWDAKTGSPIREHEINSTLFGAGPFRGIVWGPRGAFAVFIRIELLQLQKTPTAFPDDFRVWEFTDPKTAPPLLATGFGGDLVMLGPLVGVVVERPKKSAEYLDFRFSADGTRVAASWQSANGKKHGIHVYELKATDTAAKLKRVGEIDLGGEGADGFRLSADGTALVTFRDLANADAEECTATAWDVAAGTPGKAVRVPRSPHHPPALTPDGRELVVPVWSDGEAGYDLVALGSGARRKLPRFRSAPAPDAPDAWNRGTDAAFVPSSRVFVHPGAPTLVTDLADGTELARLSGHVNRPTAVAVSADSNTIATADTHGLVRLWDAKTLRAINDAPGHRAKVQHAQLSPDGKRLLTWAADHTVRLWDIASGKELRAFTGATDNCAPLFSLDGTAVLYLTKDKLIARDLQTGLEVPLPKDADDLEPRVAKRETPRVSVEGAHDGARLRETASGKVRRTLTGHRGEVRVLGFTPDGTKLLTAGGDHTVLVWDMRLAHVPLPDALKKETDAAKLWAALADGKADAAYLAMARLAREPDAAVKLLRMKLTPAKKGETSDEVADARAVELLEALDTAAARAFLKELAGGHADAFRTQDANRALARAKR